MDESMDAIILERQNKKLRQRSVLLVMQYIFHRFLVDLNVQMTTFYYDSRALVSSSQATHNISYHPRVRRWLFVIYNRNGSTGIPIIVFNHTIIFFLFFPLSSSSFVACFALECFHFHNTLQSSLFWLFSRLCACSTIFTERKPDFKTRFYVHMARALPTCFCFRFIFFVVYFSFFFFLSFTSLAVAKVDRHKTSSSSRYVRYTCSHAGTLLNYYTRHWIEQLSIWTRLLTWNDTCSFSVSKSKLCSVKQFAWYWSTDNKRWKMSATPNITL